LGVGVLGPDVDRLARLHKNFRTARELIEVAHEPQDALSTTGGDLRHVIVEDVQSAPSPDVLASACSANMSRTASRA
jgi:hypothetical protein